MYHRPRYLVSAAIALVFNLSIASSNTTVRASSESCETLREWAALTYADRSPTLAELTAFDASRQRAIFSALAPAARVSLWREHLDALSQRPEFTAAQRAACPAGVLVAVATVASMPTCDRWRPRW